MMLKKVAFFVVLTVTVISLSYGSTTRLQSLLVGGFIEDDSDIFTNPALVAYYPNLVIGELGVYSSYEYKNGFYVPSQWMAVTCGKGALAGGLVFNRDLPIVDYIAGYDMETPFYRTQRPVNPIEVMFAYGSNGTAFGGRVYKAGADSTYEYELDGDIQSKRETGSSVLDFAGGLAMDLGNGNKLDGYVNVGLFSFSATQEYPSDTIKTEYDYRSEGGKYIEAGGRAFYPVTRQTRMVPLVRFSTSSFTYTEDTKYQDPDTTYTDTWEVKESEMSFRVGVGAETELGRSGILACGVSLIYGSEKSEYENTTYETTSFILPMFQAGLEANLTKWFIARIGAQKIHSKVTDKSTYEAESSLKQDSEWTRTYSASEGLSDFLALGFGIRLDRLLIDATLCEEIPFTGTYLLSGIPENICGKITATYRF